MTTTGFSDAQEVAQVLLERGSDPRTKDRHGELPFDMASNDETRAVWRRGRRTESEQKMTCFLGLSHRMEGITGNPIIKWFMFFSKMGDRLRDASILGQTQWSSHPFILILIRLPLKRFLFGRHGT